MCCKCKYDGHATANGGGSSTAAGGRRSPPGQRVVDGDFQNIELPTRSGQAAAAAALDEGAADGSSAAQPINPTAPDLDDKDMPPSYESLFKKQNNVISV